MLKCSTLFLVSLLTRLCLAGPLTPLEPAPGDTFTEGGPLRIAWNADTTGAWKVTNIEVMTGDNFNMRHLTTLATIDGTDATNTSITVGCPSVNPHSAIYFLQFSAVGQVMWTGRFVIVGSDGTTVLPSNTTQPDGSNIPWGIGTLVSPSLPGSPPPSTAPSGQIDASGSNDASGTPDTTSSGGGLSNSTQGLGASVPSSTGSSTSISVPTAVGPLPGETSPPPVSSSGSSQPTSVPDPNTNTNSTDSPDDTNKNSAITVTRGISNLAAVSIVFITTLSLTAHLS